MNFTYIIVLLIFLIISYFLSLRANTEIKAKSLPIIYSSLLLAIIFFALDIIGKFIGLWSFANTFTHGINLWSVPVEESLYYFTLSIMSITIFELINSKMSPNADASKYRIAAFVLSLLFVASCFFDTNADLTFYANLPAGLIVFAIFKSKNKLLPQYFLSYLIFLVPFIIINVIKSYWSIINYNESAIIGFKFWAMPVEQLAIGLIVMSMSLLIFKKFFSKSLGKNERLSIK